jgi:hypothetical protein
VGRVLSNGVAQQTWREDAFDAINNQVVFGG